MSLILYGQRKPLKDINIDLYELLKPYDKLILDNDEYVIKTWYDIDKWIRIHNDNDNDNKNKLYVNSKKLYFLVNDEPYTLNENRLVKSFGTSFKIDPIVIENVFSATWCNKLIDIFAGQELNIGPDKYGRYDFLNKDIAKQIHKYISRHIDIGSTKISHRLYMNKYWPDSSYIGKHVDGQITDSYGNKSIRSVIIYLNTCEGGETTVHCQGHQVNIAPKVGSVLILSQQSLHEAGPPTDGTFKYILRTDLISL